MRRLKSEVVSRAARSTARLAASTISRSVNGLEVFSNWNDCRPAETTRARWLCGYFIAESITACGRFCFRFSVAILAKASDCRWALRKNSSRSTEMYRDQTDRLSRTMTTPRAMGVMVDHKPRTLMSITLLLWLRGAHCTWKLTVSV